MSGTTEAFARVMIDALLEDAGWNLTDGSSVLFEHALPDGTQADYVLCDRQGRPMAVLEAKRASIDPIAAQDQGRHYARQLGVPFVFLSNGEEVRFLDGEADAHARKIAGFYAQDDLERRIAARRVRRELSPAHLAVEDGASREPRHDEVDGLRAIETGIKHVHADEYPRIFLLLEALDDGARIRRRAAADIADYEVRIARGRVGLQVRKMLVEHLRQRLGMAPGHREHEGLAPCGPAPERQYAQIVEAVRSASSVAESSSFIATALTASLMNQFLGDGP